MEATTTRHQLQFHLHLHFISLSFRQLFHFFLLFVAFLELLYVTGYLWKCKHDRWVVDDHMIDLMPNVTRWLSGEGIRGLKFYPILTWHHLLFFFIISSCVEESAFFSIIQNETLNRQMKHLRTQMFCTCHCLLVLRKHDHCDELRVITWYHHCFQPIRVKVRVISFSINYVYLVLFTDVAIQ